ncbi:MAG: inositol monophosphatase [Proteobacteria bacterium]|nr:inositol monophosphatase [Pseudomonadota bacterium]
MQLPDSTAVIGIMRDVAATEIMPRFRMLAAHEIREKRPGDKVTAADVASEAALRRHLAELLPGSLVLGEEGYETDPDSLKTLGGEAPVWIVDPVDGTDNYARGVPPFCVIVALFWQGAARAGWIYDPNADETVCATAGSGAFRVDKTGQETRLGTLAPLPFAEQSGSIGSKFAARMQRTADAAGIACPSRFSRARCVGREYMDMALGRLHFARFAGLLKPWDHAAGALIVREIGGRAEVSETGATYEPGPVLERKTLLVTGDAASFAPLADLISRTG